MATVVLQLLTFCSKVARTIPVAIDIRIAGHEALTNLDPDALLKGVARRRRSSACSCLLSCMQFIN
eukprot:6198168-Pleurochrysis_carterae.AAC.1